MPVRPILYAALLTLGSAGAAWPQDHRMASCIAGGGDKPTLNARVLKGVTFTQEDQAIGSESDESGASTTLYRRTGVEKATLPGGVSLTVMQGGCEYYGTAYAFRLPKTDKPLTDAPFWLRRAGDLMGMIEPANQDIIVDMRALRRNLVKRAREPGARFTEGVFEGVLEPGDIATTYSVRIAQEQDATLLTINHSVGPL